MKSRAWLSYLLSMTQGNEPVKLWYPNPFSWTKQLSHLNWVVQGTPVISVEKKRDLGCEKAKVANGSMFIKEM